MGQVGGDGVALFHASIVLLALAWVTYGARVGVRIWRKALGLDDFLMFMGLVRAKQRPILDYNNY